jgi:CRISPR system Cascade subunit CasD
MDYHTAQSPSGKSSRNQVTRRAEINRGKLRTILSTREYRVDACYTAAIWQRGEKKHPLDTISDALVHPVFTPYFGRKSCPFGAPFGPRILETEGLVEAYSEYEPFAAMVPALLELSVERSIAFEADETICQPDPIRVETRRDGLISRRNWLFSEREELIATLDGGSTPN